MTRKIPLLFRITALWLAFCIAAGLYFAVASLAPSADIQTASHGNVVRVSLEGWPKGEAHILIQNERHIVIWHLDDAELALAMAQFNPEMPESAWRAALEDGTFEREMGPRDFLKLRWIIVSPVNDGSLGCVTLAQGCDYSGFYDPCEQTHFDIFGRYQKGPETQNLKHVPKEFSAGGVSVLLDVTHMPKLPNR
ncbi:hypothetical protein [Primorskyibacter sp. S187A]|uniref:hypothetical protein n=1 Tax=Primorskyibacter sp. S187A TaxID=3415130 RepID=UPI003C7B4EF0